MLCGEYSLVSACCVEKSSSALAPTIVTMPFRSVPRARSLGRRPAAPRTLVSRETIHVDGLQVTVLRKKNRNMYLRVKPPYGALEVTAPVRMPIETIERFVRERRDWIDDALRKMAQARSRTFSSSQLNTDIPTKLTIAHEPTESRREEHDDQDSFVWNQQYLEQARINIERQLPDLLKKWVPIIGREPSKITLRTMTSRWGSCTPKTARIRLNLQLGLMDPQFLEYVLVHEMVHLWEKGHGAAFQARMTDALPQWKQLRKELNACTILAAPEVQ